MTRKEKDSNEQCFLRRLGGITISSELFLTLLKPALEDELPNDAIITHMEYEAASGKIKFIIASQEFEPVYEDAHVLYKGYRRF